MSLTPNFVLLYWSENQTMTVPLCSTFFWTTPGGILG